MSENLRLGEIITTTQERDAIHIAVLPVTCAEALNPGQRVGLNERGEASLYADPAIGIVDPFLRSTTRMGQSCWLFLFPGSITSLRHQWTHPALDGSPDKVAARKVIEQMADDMGLSYSTLMDYGRQHAMGWDDGYVVQRDSEEWRDGFNADVFWPAYEIVTGETVPEDKKDHFFSCSC